MRSIRATYPHEADRILEIINAAAEVYRGVIPPEHWNDPYMVVGQFQRELAAGISFWGCEVDNELVGVMGVQPVRDVDLIRHAYVLPRCQGSGIGAELLLFLRRRSERRMLIGTWAAATWAIRFYQREGFHLTSRERAADLLRTYWTISEAQIEHSVVLTRAAPGTSASPQSRASAGT